MRELLTAQLDQQRIMTEAMFTLVETLKNQQPQDFPREQTVFNFQNENENPIVRKKPSKKLIVAIAWLLKNDPHLERRVVDVANAVGVSLGTVDAARKAIRSGEYREMLSL